jgi:hypothetical protein
VKNDLEASLEWRYDNDSHALGFTMFSPQYDYSQLYFRGKKEDRLFKVKVRPSKSAVKLSLKGDLEVLNIPYSYMAQLNVNSNFLNPLKHFFKLDDFTKFAQTKTSCA